jgi:A/G-specific adenine glycosylase
VAARLWQLAEDFTPSQRCGDYTQAMMDLGATVCTRSKPMCERCPVQEACQANLLGLTHSFPAPKPRKTLPVKSLVMLMLHDMDQRLLLEKRPPTGIWGGLWSLPEFVDVQALKDWCSHQGYCFDQLITHEAQRHTFSHYHLDFVPMSAGLQNPINNVMEGGQWVWYKASEINSLGLPAPVKCLLQQRAKEVDYDENG